MLQQYANAALSNVHIGDALGNLLQLVRRQRLRLPGNLVQFFKALAMAEGLLLKIHPESSFADYLLPMAVLKVHIRSFDTQCTLGISCHCLGWLS